VEKEGLAGENEAWEGQQESREIRESSIAPVNGPQEQYCFSCNRKKPLIDFGRFFTCNACRERNKRANRAWHARQKANYFFIKKKLLKKTIISRTLIYYISASLRAQCGYI
jgi:hypothetical protein